MFSASYQQYASTPSSASAASQAKIDSLADKLKQDSSFVEDKRRAFYNNPVGRELAKEMILSDEGLQDEIAKNIWKGLTDIAPGYAYVPPSWKDIDVKAMLLSPNEQDQFRVFTNYEVVLFNKAAFGLSDTEKLLSARVEEASFSAAATFDEKMDRIFDKVRAEFEANGLTFDESKSYAFSLDTSVFKFSVSGGTDAENTLIEKVLNKNDYTGQNLLNTLSAVYSHRQENGSFLPWIADGARSQEAVLTYGVTSVSKDYAKQMDQLFSAWDRCRMDESLKEQYGFGVDALAYQGGKLIGKTPEAQAVIDADEWDFMKKTGYAFISNTKSYTGTPEFSQPLFVYENGKFQTTYKIYDATCKEATDSESILAAAQRKVSKMDAFFEKGRDGVLSERPDSLESQLYDRLKQDPSFQITEGKRFWDFAAGLDVARQLILSDGDMLSKVAEMMWKRFLGQTAKDDGIFLPIGYQGFNIKSILAGEDQAAINEVMLSYNLVLGQKACTSGLSQVEQYLRSGHS